MSHSGAMISHPKKKVVWLPERGSPKGKEEKVLAPKETQKLLSLKIKKTPSRVVVMGCSVVLVL